MYHLIALLTSPASFCFQRGAAFLGLRTHATRSVRNVITPVNSSRHGLFFSPTWPLFLLAIRHWRAFPTDNSLHSARNRRETGKENFCQAFLPILVYFIMLLRPPARFIPFRTVPQGLPDITCRQMRATLPLRTITAGKSLSLATPP